MFPRNYWYVAAWDHEVTDRPMARAILDEPLVFYNKSDGTPAVPRVIGKLLEQETGTRAAAE